MGTELSPPLPLRNPSTPTIILLSEISMAMGNTTQWLKNPTIRLSQQGFTMEMETEVFHSQPHLRKVGPLTFRTELQPISTETDSMILLSQLAVKLGRTILRQ